MIKTAVMVETIYEDYEQADEHYLRIIKANRIWMNNKNEAKKFLKRQSKESNYILGTYFILDVEDTDNGIVCTIRKKYEIHKKGTKTIRKLL